MNGIKALRHCSVLICLFLTCSLHPVRADDTAGKPDEPPAVAITVGKSQWLEASGERFLGIFTRSTTGVSLGGVIILPSLGRTPDWPDVIAPLRKALPTHGWSTSEPTPEDFEFRLAG